MVILTRIVPIALLIPALILFSIFQFKRRNFKTAVTNVTFFCYVYLLYAFLLFPFQIAWSEEFQHEVTINWIPFLEIIKLFPCENVRYLITPIKDCFINFVMLMPVGAYVFYKLKRKNPILIAVSFGISCELLQLLFNLIGHSNVRQVDITDLILNVAGAVLGLLIGRCIENRSRNRA